MSPHGTKREFGQGHFYAGNPTHSGRSIQRRQSQFDCVVDLHTLSFTGDASGVGSLAATNDEGK
jgi:hypothetical protein